MTSTIAAMGSHFETLNAYSRGDMSRGTAMELLGLTWYGDLLDRLKLHGVDRPRASDEDMAVMKASLDQVFGAQSKS